MLFVEVNCVCMLVGIIEHLSKRCLVICVYLCYPGSISPLTCLPRLVFWGDILLSFMLFVPKDLSISCLYKSGVYTEVKIGNSFREVIF